MWIFTRVFTALCTLIPAFDLGLTRLTYTSRYPTLKLERVTSLCPLGSRNIRQLIKRPRHNTIYSTICFYHNIITSCRVKLSTEIKVKLTAETDNTYTETLVISDITKTEFNNCFVGKLHR
jgi:hypothetical protein